VHSDRGAGDVISDLRRSISVSPRLTTLTLSQRFGVTSFPVFLLFGVVLAFILGQAVQSIALNGARQTAYDNLHAQLLHRISSRELAAGQMTVDRYRSFDAFIRSSILSDRTIRVKVWNRHGRVIYSDDRRISGHTFAIAGELSEALHGELASEVSDLSKSENRDDRRYGKLLEVYIPIRYQPRGQTLGAFELYQTYGPVERQITSLQHSGYALLAGGLMALYLLLFGIVRHGSNTIIEQQQRLLKQAFHDALTGLPNRTLLHDRLQQAILNAHRSSGSVSLLLMDMDRFKEINDTFGHHHGDLLLQQFGSRLHGALRQSDTIARLGGDEFAVLLPETEQQGAIEVAEKILRTLSPTFTVQGYDRGVGASIGISSYPQHGTDASTLLQRADVAMYHAKRTDSGFAVYTTEHDDYSPDRLALISALRQAIDQDQLYLHYQPKMNLKTQRVDGVEALVRWQHPERGMILPAEFIPLAEHTGLIRPLTRWVLSRALYQSREWRTAGLDLSVAVNLSARSLHDPDLVATVVELLDTWDVPADRLEIELTESSLMADPVRGAEILARLHDMGVRIAIDDFGTGYSSLAYLRRLPVDEIKIDRSFVQNMAANDDDAFIIRSVSDLGHSLGLEVVAEGVEDQRSLQLLAVMGCELAQGYHLSCALAPHELESWLVIPRVALAT
jgi:diguanylate cyclase (GGDEF)-like protein